MNSCPVIVLMALLTTAVPCAARTVTVGGPDGDFSTIAAAIQAASAGDVVRVRSGRYREVLALDKSLALIGEGRPTIAGPGRGSVVVITAPDCELRGFVIENGGMGETNQMDAAVQVRSNGNHITDNVMRRTFYGIVVVEARANEMADNTIAGARELAFGRRGDGIYLLRAPQNVVVRNHVSGERDGIYFQYTSGSRAQGNVVRDSRYGLHDMFSDDTVIADNHFEDSAVGANLMNSRRITFERNVIARNRGIPGVGLALKDCDDSTLSGNAIVENARGVLLDGSSKNRFLDNTFTRNDTAATLFSSAEQNAFAGNRFVDNWSDLVLSGRESGTRWTVDGRGNFWSRYRGFDFDGDGIGDAPHPIVGAFERLEGANPAARLFLQSPVAAGLELASRLSGRPSSDSLDDRPSVVDTAEERGLAVSTRAPLMLSVLIVSLAAMAVLTRMCRIRACSL